MDRKFDVLTGGQRGEQRALLEKDAPASLDRLALLLVDLVEIDAEHFDAALLLFGSSPMMVRNNTDLPAPDAPTKPRISPR